MVPKKLAFFIILPPDASFPDFLKDSLGSYLGKIRPGCLQEWRLHVETSHLCAIPDPWSHKKPVLLWPFTSMLLFFPPYPLLTRMGCKNTHDTRMLPAEISLVYEFVWKKKWHADRGFFYPLSLFFCQAIWYFCEVPVSRIMYKDLTSHFEKHSKLLPS